jgi:hypothetical protein
MTGYCADSVGFYGTTSSPTAASKGYCVLPPPQKKTDISSCENGSDPRTRWICVGNIVDPFPYPIGNVISPYARPATDKINYCKSLSGIEADYCFSSIVKYGYVSVSVQQEACSMVSNQNPWFKNDCPSN